MKIYIAGKITGNPNYKSEFAQAEQILKKRKFIVLNPAVLPEGMSKDDYMRICTAMLDSADAIYLLPNYEDSPGARLECMYARYTEKLLYVFEDETGGCIH